MTLETFTVVSPGTLIPAVVLMVLGVVSVLAMLSRGRKRASIAGAILVLVIFVTSGAMV